MTMKNKTNLEAAMYKKTNVLLLAALLFAGPSAAAQGYGVTSPAGDAAQPAHPAAAVAAQQEEAECPICLEPLTPYTGTCFLKCGHALHINCLNQLVQQQGVNTLCPVCRNQNGQEVATNLTTINHIIQAKEVLLANPTTRPIAKRLFTDALLQELRKEQYLHFVLQYEYLLEQAPEDMIRLFKTARAQQNQETLHAFLSHYPITDPIAVACRPDTQNDQPGIIEIVPNMSRQLLIDSFRYCETNAQAQQELATTGPDATIALNATSAPALKLLLALALIAREENNGELIDLLQSLSLEQLIDAENTATSLILRCPCSAEILKTLDTNILAEVEKLLTKEMLTRFLSGDEQAIHNVLTSLNQRKAETKLLSAMTQKLLEQISPFLLSEISSSRCYAFSPDGAVLAVASHPSSNDGIIQLINVKTGRIIRTLQHHAHTVKCITFSTDGKLIATGSEDSTAQVIRIETGESLCLVKHEGTVFSVAISPDGTLLATGSKDTTAKITDIAHNHTIRTIKHTPGSIIGSIFSVFFSPDGTHLAIVNNSNYAKIINIETNQTTAICHSGRSYAFSPNGTCLFTRHADSGSAKVSHIATNTTVYDTNLCVITINFSPDETYYVTTESTGNILIRNIKTHEEFPLQNFSRGGIYAIAFSPDSKHIAVSTSQKTFIINLRLKKLILTIASPRSLIAFSPDGTLIATGSLDGALAITHIATNQNIYRSAQNLNQIDSLTFNADGTTLLIKTTTTIHKLPVRLSLNQNILVHALQEQDPLRYTDDLPESIQELLQTLPVELQAQLVRKPGIMRKLTQHTKHAASAAAAHLPTARTVLKNTGIIAGAALLTETSGRALLRAIGDSTPARTAACFTLPIALGLYAGRAASHYFSTPAITLDAPLIPGQTLQHPPHDHAQHAQANPAAAAQEQPFAPCPSGEHDRNKTACGCTYGDRDRTREPYNDYDDAD